MTETDIQREALEALKLIGVWAFRVNAGQRGTVRLAPKGTPDICLPGLGWLEAKLPGERLNPDQVKWHERAEREGVRVAIFQTPREAVDIVLGWIRERAQ